MARTKKESAIEKKFSAYELKLVKESEWTYEVDNKVSSPMQAYLIINKVFSLESLAEEKFVMLCFNTKNAVVGAFEVSKGSLNTSIVHPREVFKRAILSNANAILFAHNHPSNDLNPSSEDINITKRLESAGDVIGIKVLDHLIIGESNFYSFKENGQMS